MQTVRNYLQYVRISLLFTKHIFPTFQIRVNIDYSKKVKLDPARLLLHPVYIHVKSSLKIAWKVGRNFLIKWGIRTNHSTTEYLPLRRTTQINMTIILRVDLKELLV